MLNLVPAEEVIWNLSGAFVQLQDAYGNDLRVTAPISTMVLWAMSQIYEVKKFEHITEETKTLMAETFKRNIDPADWLVRHVERLQDETNKKTHAYA